jgi:hypothetical protein
LCVTLFRNRLCLLTYHSILHNKCIRVLAVELAGRGALLRHLSCYVESNNCHCWPFGFSLATLFHLSTVIAACCKALAFLLGPNLHAVIATVWPSTLERHVQRAGQRYRMPAHTEYGTGPPAKKHKRAAVASAGWQGGRAMATATGYSAKASTPTHTCVLLPARGYKTFCTDNSQQIDRALSFLSSLPVQMLCLPGWYCWDRPSWSDHGVMAVITTVQCFDCLNPCHATQSQERQLVSACCACQSARSTSVFRLSESLPCNTKSGKATGECLLCMPVC